MAKPIPRIVTVLVGILAMTAGRPGGAVAFTEPFFTEVKTYAYGGSHGNPGTWTYVPEAGTGTIEAETGSRWWDCAPNCSIPPGAGLGWSMAQGNAVNGELRVAAAARNLSSSVSEWDVVTPFGTFHVVPANWGEAYAETYLRSVWRIDPGDGALAPGDPVQVTARFQLTGNVDNGPNARFGAAVLLNTRTDASWVSNTEAIDLHTVRDMIGRGLPFGHVLRDGNTSGPVSLDESYTGTFHVGDVLVMETLLDVNAGAPNDGNQKEVWSRFDQSLHSAIQMQTPGAVLVAVPEPGTWAMLAAGLGLLGFVARRRSSRH